MTLVLKAKARDFISGKEMDFTMFSDENIDIHHIFPRAYYEAGDFMTHFDADDIFPRAYYEAQHYSKTKWNSIVNKTPLSYRTNRIIGGNAPSVYLKKIERGGWGVAGRQIY
ncbi:MAG: hypothetical protein LBR98_02990 [Syntrophomonadaceae bacterium]|jgi:hypothetical protein|nr:hypothetical protein [Syntrophomonadaceae bacterium]